MSTKIETEWRAVLTPEQFRVLREAATESPGSGEYNKHFPNKGIYCCAACGTELYKADTKFDSGCGWPAFYDAIPGKISQSLDYSNLQKRVEIKCKNCDSHLGHLFENEGFKNPTNKRHCVNSISLNFKDEDLKQ